MTGPNIQVQCSPDGDDESTRGNKKSDRPGAGDDNDGILHPFRHTDGEWMWLVVIVKRTRFSDRTKCFYHSLLGLREGDHFGTVQVDLGESDLGSVIEASNKLST